jgi:CRP-like cAMP-binding protein
LRRKLLPEPPNRKAFLHASLLFLPLLFPTLTGDIIIKEGTIGSKMYFIQEGIVDIVMANGEVSVERQAISDGHL